MQAKFKVTLDSGTVQDVETNFADIIAFEEKYDVSASEMSTNARATWLAFLAWSGLKRTKATAETFEVWVQTVASLEAIDSPKD